MQAGTTITNNGHDQRHGDAEHTVARDRRAAPSPPARRSATAAGISGYFSYNAATGDLTVSGGKTGTLAAGTYCFNNLTLSGGSA